MSRLAGLAVDGDPDLVRGLRADFVKANRCQQTGDGVLDGGGYHRDRFDLRGFDLRDPIGAVPKILDESPGDQALKLAVGNPESREVSRAEVGSEAGFLEFGSVQYISHTHR